MMKPPWPTRYGRDDHAPSIFLQQQVGAGPCNEESPNCERQPRRYHTGPRVLLDTSKVKKLREEGRNWRSIAMTMGCSMGSVIARMEEEYPEFMRVHRQVASPGGARAHHSPKSRG